MNQSKIESFIGGVAAKIAADIRAIEKDIVFVLREVAG